MSVMTAEDARRLTAEARAIHIPPERRGDILCELSVRASMGACRCRLELSPAEADWVEALGYKVTYRSGAPSREVVVSWL